MQNKTRRGKATCSRDSSPRLHGLFGNYSLATHRQVSYTGQIVHQQLKVDNLLSLTCFDRLKPTRRFELTNFINVHQC